jgi:hypothetical protein
MVGQNWSDGPWFSGYESWPRWMRLKASGVEFQCIDAGIQLRTPSPDFERGTAFARICADHGIGADFLLAIPQVAVDDNRIDAEDRVRLSAALLRDLVAAGL